MFTLPATVAPAETWETITLPGDAGTIDVLVRRPTLEHKLNDYGELMRGFASDDAAGAQESFRLRTAIVGWRGVQNTDGHEVPFSLAAVEKLVTIFPTVLDTLLGLATDAFRVGANLPNSVAPPVVS